MAVYVDDMEAPFGNMVMCHMIADTHVELVEMAKLIGVKLKWIQQPGNHGEHFDICKSMRKRAVECGAEEISLRELAQKTFDRRDNPNAKAQYFGEETS